METKLQTCNIMLEWKPFLLLDIQNLAKILRKQAQKVDFNIGDIRILSIDILLAMATHNMLIKQGIYYSHRYYEIIYFIIFHQIKMANAVAMMIVGAVVNALVFTGGTFLFSKLGKSNVAEEERERHDKAVEGAQTAWNKQKMQRLDFINEEMKKEHHAEQTFDYYITGKQLSTLPLEPKLSDY